MWLTGVQQNKILLKLQGRAIGRKIIEPTSIKGINAIVGMTEFDLQILVGTLKAKLVDTRGNNKLTYATNFERKQLLA